MEPRYASMDITDNNKASDQPHLATNSSASSLGGKVHKTIDYSRVSKEPKEESQNGSRLRSLGSMGSQASKKNEKKGAKRDGAQAKSKLKQSSQQKASNAARKHREGKRVQMKDQQTGCSLESEREHSNEDHPMSKDTTYRRTSVDGDYNEYVDPAGTSPPTMGQAAGHGASNEGPSPGRVHRKNQNSQHMNSSIANSSEMNSMRNEMTTRYRSKNDENDAYKFSGKKL